MTEFDDALIDNPILNSAYHEPARHWPFNEDTGRIAGDPVEGRRPSSYLTPIPGAKVGTEQQLALGVTDKETVRRNELINDIRARVKVWREGTPAWQGVTPTTRKLLEHWDVVEGRERPLFFAQREAIETAVWLTEIASKEAPHVISDLAKFSEAISNGLPRVAHKMATGTGKTVVMALIIAWHTLNKARNPQDARFADQFLVVSPGITIRDRLRVLVPSEPDNYYDEFHLIPVSMRDELNRATVEVINYHKLMRRQKESLSSGTKAVLGEHADNYEETEREMVSRVLRPFGRSGSEIVVLNDEAHHCYRTKPEDVRLDPDIRRRGFRVVEEPSEEVQEAEQEEEARVWHTGLEAINRYRGIKTVYDLSATPFFIQGSGWPEGTLFQWVVSDFPLIESVESGMVKIPRVPVRDDVDDEDPAFRALWDKVGPKLRKLSVTEARESEPVIPAELEAAFRALYDDYEGHYHEKMDGREDDPDVTPPVFIVVANSTDESNYFYRWMSGWRDDEGAYHHGVAPLFDNVVCDHPEHGEKGVRTDNIVCSSSNNPRLRSRPLSLLIDSQALDQPSDQFPKAFREAAASELEQYRREYAQRNSGDEPDDAEILREVMNTVGKPGKLGAPIRLVVSVSMLTEGWDANTVTHILGVRAFSTQLICEQVVGRALRRVSYEKDEKGRFQPEYADIYGVPWKLIPTAGKRSTDPEPNPAVQVHPVPEREDATKITFPRVVGFRVQPPNERIVVGDFDEHAQLTIDQAVEAEVIDVTGHGRVDNLDQLRELRRQQVEFDLAWRVSERMAAGNQPAASFDTVEEEIARDDVIGTRPWLFPQVLQVVRRWIDECLHLKGKTFPQMVLMSQHRSEAVDRIFGQIATATTSEGDAVILPTLDPHGSEGSTGQMHPWWTTRAPAKIYATDPEKCHINRVVADSQWEIRLAQILESMDDVDRYVKNEHLDFSVPYVMDGMKQSYLPDFIVHLQDGEQDPLKVLVEVSGQEKREKDIKTMSAATKWINAINADGRFGRWAFVELHTIDPETPDTLRRKARLWSEAHTPGEFEVTTEATTA